MRPRFRTLLFVAALATAGGALQASSDHPNLQADAIRTQQTEIRAAAQAGRGRYKDLPVARRNELYQRQDRVASLLGDVNVTTELDQHDQIQLFNELEAISAIVNKAEDDRLVCRRHKPVGSNRPTTVCRTVAQMRAASDAAAKDIRIRNLECSEAMMGPGGCPR